MGELSIGGAIRTARHRRGWTREALAFHSGLSWSAIAQIEAGRRTDVRPSSLVAVADALDVSVDYLLGRAVARRTGLLTHRALAYDNDADLVAGVAALIGDDMARGQPVLIVTSERNEALLRNALDDGTRSVEFSPAAAWYQSPTAALDSYRAWVTAKLDGGASWVRIVGELLWDGRTKGETRAWMRYEALVNLALADTPGEILCAYDARAVSTDVLAGARETHPHVDGPNPAYRDPEQYILGR